MLIKCAIFNTPPARFGATGSCVLNTIFFRPLGPGHRSLKKGPPFYRIKIKLPLTGAEVPVRGYTALVDPVLSCSPSTKRYDHPGKISTG